MTLVRSNTSPMNYWNTDFVNMMNKFLNEDMNDLSCEYKPAVNIQEMDEKFEMEFVVPGMNKEDFHVKYENGRLEVSAELEKAAVVENEENEEGKEAKENVVKEKFIRKEFTRRAFKRNFKISQTVVDSENITANYENGILIVTLPKREEAKPKPAKEIAIA